MGNVKIIVALRAILMNKIASLQPIQYGVSIDFLLHDFTKESMHWKLIPSYIQKFHFVDVIAMDNLLISKSMLSRKSYCLALAHGVRTQKEAMPISQYTVQILIAFIGCKGKYTSTYFGVIVVVGKLGFEICKSKWR